VTFRSQSSPGLRRLPACFAVLACCAATVLFAQARHRAASAAPFLKEPGGLRLGTLVRGAQFDLTRTQGDWVQTSVEGWILAASTQATSREGFDLSVIAGGGENVRATPRGAIVARLEEGTLLSRLGTRGGWIRVRRSGWAARAAMGLAGNSTLAAATPAPAPPAAPPRTARRLPPPPPPPPERSRSARRLPPARSPAPDTSPPASPPAAPPPGPPASTARPESTSVGASNEEQVTLRSGTSLAQTPDGRSLAVLASPGEVSVVERARDWVKVRVEGWVRAVEVAPSSAGPRITGAMIRETPHKFVGQTLHWRLQFLAFQKADQLRPEIPEGQPYMLARGPLPEAGFVYLTLTSEQLAELKGLRPLDEVAIEGVLRAPRTKYLATPVVELVAVK